MANNFPAPHTDTQVKSDFTDRARVSIVDAGTDDMRGPDSTMNTEVDSRGLEHVESVEVDSTPTTLLAAVRDFGGVSKWNRPVTGEGGEEYDPDVLGTGLRGLESTAARSSLGIDPTD